MLKNIVFLNRFYFFVFCEFSIFSKNKKQMDLFCHFEKAYELELEFRDITCFFKKQKHFIQEIK